MAFQRRKPAAIGIKAPYPGIIEPAWRFRSTRPQKANAGSMRVKFDGYRVQLHLIHEAVTIYTRRGNDWTKRFKKVATKTPSERSADR